jgi:hypothetical protein
LEALVQKSDENVREHQLRIIELESALKKENRKVSIKEVAGMSGIFGFGHQPIQLSSHTPIMHTPPGFNSNMLVPRGGGSIAGSRKYN